MYTASAITEATSLVTLPYGAHASITNRIDLSPTMSFSCTPRPRVLCFSRDRVLGETRRSILQRQYNAEFVNSLEELADLASGAPFDAIVLCHTLSLAECVGCLEIAKRLWPSARIISVASPSGKRQVQFGAKIFGLEGPQALLDAVQDVLHPRVSGIGTN